MGIKASDVRGLVRTVVVEVPEVGDLHVDYRPGAYTQDFEDRLGRLAQEFARDAESDGAEKLGERIAEVRKRYGEALGEVVAGWDYLDDDGRPLPISLETFERELPSFLRDAIWDAIREDQKVPKAKAKSSG